MKRFSKPVVLMLLWAGLTLHAGCRQDGRTLQHISYPAVVLGLSRVAFVELAERNSYPGVAGDMTVALCHAVQARGLFGLKIIDRQDPICETVSLDGHDGFTLEQLRELRETFKCDGILLGSMSDFRPYPRMQLGLSLRLLDLKRGRLAWAVDHVWDTTDKAVEKRIKRYFNDQVRSGYEPMDWRIVMISPKAFEKFIAYEVAETLPDATRLKTPRGGGR